MIEVKNLTKIYHTKKGQAVAALNGINLTIEDKGLVFLLGKSGSGKSTLLNLLGGLDTYTDGDIVIKGKSTKDFQQNAFDSYRNTFVGFIFQEFNILEDYSVGQNISMALELQHKLSDRAAIDALLRQVDLEGYFDRKPNELSGGQKQRVAIARALIKQPEIIMADEPTGALDSKTGVQVFETLRAIAREKLVIVVTHDRESAELYGDRIIELSDGNIISDRIRSAGAESGFVEQNVTVVNDKLIKVKAGTALTAEDLIKINAVLKSAKDDVFFSADAAANLEFTRKSAVVGEKGKFAPTTKENLSVKAYSAKDFSLVKSRLPFKDSFRMGVSGLGHKKVRLVFTILLSFIAFTMAGFSATVALFDSVKTEYKTLQQIGAQNIVVESRTAENYGFGLSYGPAGAEGITDAQKAKLQELTGVKPTDILNFPEQNTTVNLVSNLASYPYDKKEMKLYYQTELDTFAHVTNAEDLKLTPIGASRLPLTSREIAITDYTADSFIKYGYKDGDVKIAVNSPEELLGKKISTNNSSIFLTIVGVYKTPENKSNFDKYKNVAMDDAMSSMAFETSNLMMGITFVADDFMTAPENPESEKSFYVYGGTLHAVGFQNPYLDTVQLFDKAVIDPDIHFAPDVRAKDYIVLGKDALKVIFPELQPLWSDEEFQVAFDAMSAEKRTVSLEYYVEGNTVQTMCEIAAYNAGFAFSSQTVIVTETIYNRLDVLINDSYPVRINSDYAIGGDGHEGFYTDRYYDFYSYEKMSFKQRLNIYWGKNKPAKTELTENEIVMPISMFRDPQDNALLPSVQELQERFDAMNKAAVFGAYTWDGDRYAIEGGKKLTIVGLGIDSNYAAISAKLLDALIEAQHAPRRTVITLSGNAAQDKKTVDYINDTVEKNGKIYSKLVITSHITPLMDMALSIVSVLKIVFMYAAIAFSVFAALLLMNFIGASVMLKKKDIGVLRAIGARGTDIFKIFLNEGLVIGIINFVLASIGLAVASVVTNSALGVAVLLAHPLPYLLMAGLSILVVLVSTAIPVSKVARKKPIDAINNR